jgi:hypothetical protein
MDKKLSRIKHIMGKYYFKSKMIHPINLLRDKKLNSLLNIKDNREFETFSGVKVGSEEHNERLEVFNYFYKEGDSDTQIEHTWNMIQFERRQQSAEYNKKPVRERKDNQNPITNTINYGSGHGGYSSIRVPSKKHKNRFKNFLKLFPRFKNL